MAKDNLRTVTIKSIQRTNEDTFLIKLHAAGVKGSRPETPSAKEMTGLDKGTMDILNHVMDIEERDGKLPGLGYDVQLGYKKGRVVLRDL